MDIFEHCHQAEVLSIELIIEFFVCYNFQNTLNAFEKEIKQFDFPLPDPFPIFKERIKRNHVSLLMRLMERCEHNEFFEKWVSVVPDNIRSLIEYKKLTIYLHTFFATMKYRNKSGEEANAKWKITRDISTSNMQAKVTSADFSKTEIPIQKLEKTSGTFIIENPNFLQNLPIVESQENFAKLEKEEIFVNDESREEDELSSNREYEPDSLENETDSNNEIESIDTLKKKNSDTSAMEMFKIFLSQNGSEFTNDPEFLPFFALPFVENPKLHPTFTKVFEENWLNDLKEALKRFLINYSCGKDVTPRLVKLCLDNDSHNMLEEKVYTTPDENIKRLKEVKRKLHRLKKDHQRLVGVASELSCALEKSVQGEAVNLKSTLSNCVKIFPELFAVSYAEHPRKWQKWEQIPLLEEKKINYNQIDVRKIKQDLSFGSVKSRLLLLQALRWFITKCNAEEREHIITWFCRQDLLGLKTNFISDSLVPTSSPHPIQQAVARLLNALASFNTGRDYIGSSKITLQLLIDITKQNALDSITEDMIIATLQKLSLRRSLCEEMIKNGILDWLLTKIDPGSMKKYTLEYSTSLIMNLSIFTPSTFWNSHEMQACSLIKLLKSPNKQVVEFVCGTLCSILRSDFANNYCRSYDLGNFLSDCLINHKGDDNLEKQIETLLSLHDREIAIDALQMNSNLFSDDDMEDPDELESEIDENDLVKGSPSGENLLSEHYRLLFTTPSMVDRQSRRASRIILRPATPISNKVPSWARMHQ